MKTVFLYGIGGPEVQYRVLRYTRLDDEDITIRTLLYEAHELKAKRPDVERVFAVDNRRGLGRDF